MLKQKSLNRNAGSRMIGLTRTESPVCPRKLGHDSILVSNLLEKKHLLQTGNPAHKRFKTALVLQGGVFLGSYGGGVAWGLEDAGLTDAFDYVIGVSTGSITGAYFLAEQMALGAPIFYEDLVDGNFLNFRRTNGVINLQYLIDIFETKKVLDVQKVVASRSELLVPVTNMKTGKGEVFSLKDESINPMMLIKAALSLPGLYNHPTEINGHIYCDGIYGFANPVDYAVSELGCTDVVVVTNRACDHRNDPLHYSLFEKISAKAFLRGMSPEFREAFITRRKANGLDRELMWGESPRANIGLICREEMPIHRFTQDGDKIKQVVNAARRQAFGLFKS